MTASALAGRIEMVLRRRHRNARVVEVCALRGGYSSLTYRATLSGAPWPEAVAKVAPAGVAPTGNRDVLRQAHALRAVASAGTVPVPQVIAIDAGAPPGVPPLVLMELVAGDCVEPLTESDARRLPAPAVCAARAMAAARMLAALHDLDTRSLLPLERRSTAEEDIERWTRAFRAVDDDLQPSAADHCRTALLRSVPHGLAPTLLHGDWRLGNLVCRGQEIAAAIDWEIWSLGDPRQDLAWFALLADPDRPQNVRSAAEAGLPSPSALVDAYADCRPGGAIALAWFAALVRYKQAAATALLIRNARRAAAMPVERAAPHQPVAEPGYIGSLLDKALELTR